MLSRGRRRWREDEEPEAPPPKPKTVRTRQVEHPNHERWLVSYADFITLLFAVFTMMYALSAMDAKKFAAMADSMQRAFNGKPSAAAQAGTVAVNDLNNPPAAKDKSAGGLVSLTQVRAQLEQTLAKAIGANQVSLEMDHRGLVISIREAGSFAVSSADLSMDAQTILAEIGRPLVNIANSVRVEGHTDNVPIHTERFASNWELSTARATTVVRFMIERAGIRPQRFSAAGYAEYMPRVAGSSPEARARNRRIDLIVLSPPTQAAEEPVAAVRQPSAS